MNDAATIHQLTESNKTLHDRMQALGRQRDAFRELCVEAKDFVAGFVDGAPDAPATSKIANQLDAAIESALAIHR